MKQCELTMVAMACVGLVLAGCKASTAAAAEAGKDSLGNVRESVDLTVYKEDFAQVQEVRPFGLQPGQNKLGIGDVSKLLDPSSVLFDWKDATPDTQVSSSVYDLGVGGSGGLLSRYVGKEVEMVWYGQDGREGSRQKGVLEYAAEGQIVLRTGDNLLVNPTGTVVAPKQPTVATMPQLTVETASVKPQNAKLSVAYLTRGLSWSADYTATMDPKSDALKVDCWATVTNRTGADYPNAKITLVAGSPNRAAVPATLDGEAATPLAQGWSARRRLTMGKAAGGAFMDTGVMASSAAGELYAYPVKTPATIAQNQMNRVKMLAAPATPIKKDYNLRLPALGPWSDYGWDYGGYGGGNSHRQNAQLGISFKNDEKSGLGAPLPSGAIRVYEPDASGALRYVGAAQVNDTPKDQKVDVYLSSVFDVTAEFKVLSRKQVDKRTVAKEVEVVLRNAKAGPVDLRLVQDFGIKWKLESESHKSQKLDAGRAQWTVPIPAGGEAKLRYTVRFGP